MLRLGMCAIIRISVYPVYPVTINDYANSKLSYKLSDKLGNGS